VLGPRSNNLPEDLKGRRRTCKEGEEKLESYKKMVEEILSAKEKAERDRQSAQVHVN